MKEKFRYKGPSLIPTEIILFHFQLMKMKQKAIFIMDLSFIFLPGIVGVFSPINWIWFLSFSAFLYASANIYSSYLANNNIATSRSLEVSSLFRDIKPSLREEMDSEYKNIYIPDKKDTIMISEKVNAYLRKNIFNVNLRLINHKKHLLLNKQSNAHFFKDVLIHKYFKARQEKSMFFNEKKISLYSTVDTQKSCVDVFESDYYTSYLTNDLCLLDVENYSNGQEPELLWRGCERFPCDDFKIGNPRSKPRIKELEESLMSNHIGGNTIAFTSNCRLV